MVLNYESNDFHLSYAKNYGSLTNVTSLKVAVNMADPTCLLGTVPTHNYNLCQYVKIWGNFVNT